MCGVSEYRTAGDGVVTEDEFTSWAKEQAVRVQVWERRLEDVMSDLSEQVERSVDQDAFSDRSVVFHMPQLAVAWSLVLSRGVFLFALRFDCACSAFESL